VKHLPRPNLSDKAERTFARRTKTISTDADPKAAADHAWRTRRRALADKEARSKLRGMSGSLVRCMYCEDSEGVDVDHFRPRASFPHATFSWPNWLLACSNCNSNFKRGQFPLDSAGRPLLIDPTAVDPSRHLDLSPTTGQLVARDAKGRESIKAFGLNRHVLQVARRDTLHAAGAMICRYHDARIASKDSEAEQLLRTLRRLAHGSVVMWLCAYARGAGALHVVSADVIAAILARPELP
jgi:uncharacterized protein (TIGR02646 family)